MNVNIYEWIYLIRQNDYEALSNLIQYFRPAITQIWADFYARAYDSIFVEKDDFFVDADEILINCIALYRHDFNRSFKAYYKQCVKNKGIDYCREKYLRKYEGLYTQISLDSHIRESDRVYYSDIVKSDLDVNEYVLNKVYADTIMEKARHRFDQTSFKIIELRLSGFSYPDICKKLNLEKHNVYYVWRNFKKWLIEIDSLDV